MKDLPGVSAQPGCMHEKWMAGCARAHRSVRTTCCLCTGWVGGEDEQTGAGAKGPLLCLARPHVRFYLALESALYPTSSGYNPALRPSPSV